MQIKEISHVQGNFPFFKQLYSNYIPIYHSIFIRNPHFVYTSMLNSTNTVKMYSVKYDCNKHFLEQIFFYFTTYENCANIILTPTAKWIHNLKRSGQGPLCFYGQYLFIRNPPWSDMKETQCLFIKNLPRVLRTSISNLMWKKKC